MSEKPTTQPGRAVLIAIGVIVALALVISLAIARNDVRQYEDGTPEAVAQEFIQALFDEDVDTARTYLSAELQDQCQPDDLDLWWINRSYSARFEEVAVQNDHADIEVILVSNDYEPIVFPFDSYDYSTDTELELELRSGKWEITHATWPLAGCTWR